MVRPTYDELARAVVEWDWATEQEGDALAEADANSELRRLAAALLDDRNVSDAMRRRRE